MKGFCIFWEETRCDALVSKNSLEAIWFLPTEVPYLWFGLICDFMSHKAIPFPCLWLPQTKTQGLKLPVAALVMGPAHGIWETSLRFMQNP